MYTLLILVLSVTIVSVNSKDVDEVPIGVSNCIRDFDAFFLKWKPYFKNCKTFLHTLSTVYRPEFWNYKDPAECTKDKAAWDEYSTINNGCRSLGYIVSETTYGKLANEGYNEAMKGLNTRSW